MSQAQTLQRVFETADLRRLLRLSWAERAFAWARARCFPDLETNIARVLWRKRWYRKLLNFLLVEYEMGRRRERVWGKPYWLTIDPTNFCQLRCPFCPTGAERKIRAKAILKYEDYRKVIDELGPTLLHIDFMNWGEPLLHRQIFDMVAYAKKFDIDTMISTNFNEFSEPMAEKMILSGLDTLTLSIDGLTQATYQKYRVRGDFAKVMENLRLLMRKKKELGRSNPYVIWQFLVFKHNEHEVEEVRRVGKEMGVDVVGITPAFLPFKPGIKDEWLPAKPEHRYYEPETFPDRPPWEWEAAPGESASAAASMPAKSATAPAGPAAELTGPAARQSRENSAGSVTEPGEAKKWLKGASPETAEGDRPTAPEGSVAGDRPPSVAAPSNGAPATPVIDVKVYKEPEKRPLCNWPWAGITVNPNGSVSPCCSVEEDMYDFGDVLKEGFRGLWNNGNYRRSRRHVRDYVAHRTDVKTRSSHACERCFSVGRANFTFQPWWRFPHFDWWWGLDGAKRPGGNGDGPR